MIPTFRKYFEDFKQKFIEFREHTHDLIASLNTDLHKLLKIDTELKNIENAEENKTA